MGRVLRVVNGYGSYCHPYIWGAYIKASPPRNQLNWGSKKSKLMRLLFWIQWSKYAHLLNKLSTLSLFHGSSFIEISYEQPWAVVIISEGSHPKPKIIPRSKPKRHYFLLIQWHRRYKVFRNIKFWVPPAPPNMKPEKFNCSLCCLGGYRKH